MEGKALCNTATQPQGGRRAQRWENRRLPVPGVCSLSRVRFSATPGAAARQAPLFMGFPRQDYRSGLPFPSPEGLPDPGIEPPSPALAGGFFTTAPPGKPALEIQRQKCTEKEGVKIKPLNDTFFLEDDTAWVVGSGAASAGIRSGPASDASCGSPRPTADVERFCWALGPSSLKPQPEGAV